eukprot:CAMPEP_0198225820 /NCGR_PEP_ID=MMETSP1445-20131203/102688_1 /TAXON_ID=36898 /ORGANISM="Pyramimonas sp., Strain CCMP2087" /LENGTH=216 /DNA_ID=CAMNT_0043905457 /DNA_START=49 /DNA_END=695 /DNA_ORIENTATION=+
MSICTSSVAQVGDLFEAHNERKMANGKGGKGSSAPKASNSMTGKTNSTNVADDNPKENKEVVPVTEDDAVKEEEAEDDVKSAGNCGDEQQEEAKEGSMAELYEQGDKSIARIRNNNVFERDVTQTEQDIIDQRVALQRKMFEEYEKREKQRKVQEIIGVCTDLSEAEAQVALEESGGCEDVAIAAITSEPAFLRRVKHLARCAANGGQNPAAGSRG